MVARLSRVWGELFEGLMRRIVVGMMLEETGMDDRAEKSSSCTESEFGEDRKMRDEGNG